MLRNGIIFALAALCVACNGPGGGSSATQVRVANLEKADMAIRYVASGHVVSKTIRISAPDSGRIVELPVQLNQPVHKGQLLFQIDDEEARQRVLTAEAELNSARTRAEENLALLGIRSQQGSIQVLQSLTEQQEAALKLQENQVGATLEERQKLREALRQAQLKAESSQLEWGRQRQLFAEEIASRADLETAENQYHLDQSAYREALADYQGQRKGARPELLARLRAEEQRAALGADLARQKRQEELLLEHRVRASMVEVQRLQTLLDRERYMVKRRKVQAPTDGVISQLNFQQGESVGSQTPVLSLVTHGPYWVEADVDEQDAVHVAVGQAVRILLTSMPGRSFEGKVVQVAPSLEARPQGPSDHKVLKIRVHFTQKVAELRSGLEADVEGQVKLAQQALSIPRAGLLRDQGKDYVYIVQSGKLARVEIQLGAVSSDRAEILKGLSPGQQVVVEGADGLTEGTSVQIKP